MVIEDLNDVSKDGFKLLEELDNPLWLSTWLHHLGEEALVLAYLVQQRDNGRQLQCKGQVIAKHDRQLAVICVYGHVEVWQ